jgi:hypothetical protein
MTPVDGVIRIVHVGMGVPYTNTDNGYPHVVHPVQSAVRSRTTPCFVVSSAAHMQRRGTHDTKVFVQRRLW